jgi:hypothetical protein
VVNLLRALDTGAVRKPVIRRDGQWFARQADSGVTAAVPPGLRTMVESGQPGVQRVRTDNGPALVLGIPLSATTQFYEIHSLQELDHTLRVLALILGLVAAGTAVGGADSVGTRPAWYCGRSMEWPRRRAASPAVT